MSNREVMQQALEALEDERYVSARIVDAITALRTALEQPEQKPMHPELRKMWEDYFDKCFRTQPEQMRMPKVGDKVICLEDESLGEVVSLTAGGSPDIAFDDGSRGTYMLGEFAELFGYVTPPAAQPEQEPVGCQRPWQGLTEAEIGYQAKKDDHGVYFALGALWAEAKLKEKNT